MTETTEVRYLTPRQAAELIPFKADWIRAQLAAGRLRGSRIGGRWLVEASAIDEMVAAASNTAGRSEAARRRRRRAS